MSIKVKSLNGNRSVSYCGTHREQSVRGLGDPIMMLEGLGITARDPSMERDILISAPLPVPDPTPLPLPLPLPPPLVATFVMPTTEPAAEVPTSGGSSFPSVLAPEGAPPAGPTPPPVASSARCPHPARRD